MTTSAPDWDRGLACENDLARLRGLHLHLGSVVKGQDHVLERICSMLLRGEFGLTHPRRPRGSFLLVGPTGVGKTETTNAFTAYLFNGAVPVRFDMSEYQLQSSVDKLLGEHRDDPGLFGHSVSRISRGTLLFDELEKAHPLVLDLFLQILEDGRVTLATGTTLDLRPFYVVATSNIGSAETTRMENAPFSSIERTVLMRVREVLRPELLGRFTEVLVYARLPYAVQRDICEMLIADEVRRLGALGWHLEVKDDAVEFLVRAGFHRTLGARPMRSAVERFLQEAIVAQLLRGGTGSGVVRIGPTLNGLTLSD